MTFPFDPNVKVHWTGGARVVRGQTVTVGFLTGEPRQGRIGVGWASLRDLGAARAIEP